MVRSPKVPLIVLTGGVNEEPALKAINEGAQDYLFKDEITPMGLSRSLLLSIERKSVEENLVHAIEEREENSRLLRTIMDNMRRGIIDHWRSARLCHQGHQPLRPE